MRKFIVIISLSLIVIGCSGGGGGSAGNNNAGAGGIPVITPVVSGTVSTGAIFIGVVNAYGSNGGSVENVPIDASGKYSVAVSGLAPPYLLCAVPDDTALATLCSWASGPGIANITQMTNLALYFANGEQDPAALVNSWQVNYQSVSDNLPNAQAVVNANFVGVFDVIDPGLNTDFTTYDFFTSSFDIGDTYDQILALLDVDLSSNPSVITVNGTQFPFDPNIDVSSIDIGGTTSGGAVIGPGSLTISGIDTAVIGSSFFPVISGASITQDNVAVIWQNLDASGQLSVQSAAGQVAYLIYAYGDVVKETVAIPLDSYINIIGCTGVDIEDCNNIVLDTGTKTLTLNNVQLNVPLQVGVSNLATGSIIMNGTLSWE